MKQWLDRVTGAVTMYMLVLIVLVAIQVIALVLALLGQLSYSPLAQLVSAAVAVGVTLGTGWVLSRLTRTTQHILFF